MRTNGAGLTDKELECRNCGKPFHERQNIVVVEKMEKHEYKIIGIYSNRKKAFDEVFRFVCSTSYKEFCRKINVTAINASISDDSTRHYYRFSLHRLQ